MSEISAQEFGNLQGQVKALTELVSELRGDVKELTASVNNVRGGWKTVVFFGGITATLGALFVKYILPWVATVPAR